MAHRQHTRIVVIRLAEPSPVDGDHLLSFAEELHDTFEDFDLVAAYADLKDLLADVEAGAMNLD